ncbi:MAG TPA: glutathione S-transferase family protein [Polyangia bacterium]|nr:glutathione S-transferase family protein [Polyangia bacterium]
MITLVQFISWPGLPNFSPFCMKVENYLRLTGVEYRTEVGDVRRAPKKKLPVIVDGDTRVCDSGAIIEYLKSKHGDPLGDGKLSDAERSRAHLVRRTFEESLYFAMLYSRWVPDDAWPALRKRLAPMLPAFLRPFLPELIRGQIRKQVYMQGTGRHTAEEIWALAGADLAAIATALGDAPFFGGAEPRTIDATAYGFLANVFYEPFHSPITDRALAHPNLAAYADRMKARVYPGT